MKKEIIKKYMLIGVFIFFIQNVKAQTIDTLRIQTSAICETCKAAIEKNLSFEKGVKQSDLDLETKILTVVYNPGKTNAEKIRTAISKSGYDADSVKADSKAWKRLPACCKKPGSHSME